MTAAGLETHAAVLTGGVQEILHPVDAQNRDQYFCTKSIDLEVLDVQNVEPVGRQIV